MFKKITKLTSLFAQLVKKQSQSSQLMKSHESAQHINEILQKMFFNHLQKQNI